MSDQMRDYIVYTDQGVICVEIFNPEKVISYKADCYDIYAHSPAQAVKLAIELGLQVAVGATYREPNPQRGDVTYIGLYKGQRMVSALFLEEFPMPPVIKKKIVQPEALIAA